MLILSLLLLMLLLLPAGHSARHLYHYPVGSRLVRGNRLRLLPLRVLRTPAVARQRRLVREVVGSSPLIYPNAK